MKYLSALSLLLPCLGLAQAQMSIYRPKNPQVIFGGPSSSDQPAGTAGAPAAPTNTRPAAFNPTLLQPPPVPSNPTVPTAFAVQLWSGGMANLSMPLPGTFYGFSIEMSVANHVLGKNSSILAVPFLNLMANIQQRVGGVHVRVGGNTQESAEFVQSLPNDAVIAKDYAAVTGTTNTPPLQYTAELLYMMNNISSLVNIYWYLGIPFFNTTPFDLSIIHEAQPILGDRLLALQAGNEPDLYTNHGHRPEGYNQWDYFGEVGDLVGQVGNDTQIPNKNNLFIVPSISVQWNPQDVWDTNIGQAYNADLFALSVEHYPSDNCAAQFNTGGPIRDPQATFPQYLDHTSALNNVASFLTGTAYAQSVGKPFLMFETNTASCGGFPGISDSFGAALWALDWGLTMAASNFSGALLHVGGSNTFYNPFTPPPTNESTFHQWTVGPVYYSALVMAEILGPSNASQVVDLGMNGGNIYTPGYAVYENGNPTKVVLFNFVTDMSGNTDYIASISIGGGQTGQPNASPPSVKVKYLAANTVSAQYNFTWAGQTLGGVFKSDGQLQGEAIVQDVQCDTGSNTCAVKVPAPGLAVVFLTDDALNAVSGDGTTMTFATTVQTGYTAAVDPSVLATSNGHMGMEGRIGATSEGSANAAAGIRDAVSGAMVLLTVAAGTWAIAARR